MPKKATNLHSLARGRIRASYSKFNLFNLYKKSRFNFLYKNLYQQKWTAKQETRAYHGEFMTEGRWMTTFESKPETVANLVKTDVGSVKSHAQEKATPYSIQTFAALERRLDFALFRSMFASSVRQARQFIIHGNCFVNGLKITSPGYPLKAGDVFHVKSEKVLQALGSKKPSLEESLKIDKTQIFLWNKQVKKLQANPRESLQAFTQEMKKLEDGDSRKEQYLILINKYNSELESRIVDERKNCSETNLLRKIYDCIDQNKKSKKDLTAKDFQPYYLNNEFLASSIEKIYKDTIKQLDIIPFQEKADGAEEKTTNAELASRILESSKDNELARALRNDLTALKSPYSKAIEVFFKTNKASVQEGLPYDPEWIFQLKKHEPLEATVEEVKENEAKYSKLVNLPWQKGFYGRNDPKKPYFTPWKPKPFLAPFAILPHHIEVSFKTCHAVYLRDPVARPGHSEVISPFGLDIHDRAYMYYNREGL